MGLGIYIGIAILWGGFTMYRWAKDYHNSSLDTDIQWGAAAVGLFWPFTVPAYLMFWSMRVVSNKIFEKVAKIKDEE